MCEDREKTTQRSQEEREALGDTNPPTHNRLSAFSTKQKSAVGSFHQLQNQKIQAVIIKHAMNTYRLECSI